MACLLERLVRIKTNVWSDYLIELEKLENEFKDNKIIKCY